MSEWRQDRETCERVARALAAHHPRGFDGLSQWGQERYLDDARVAMKALEAERDAAFKRGWEAAKARAVEAVENCDGDEESQLTWTLAVDAIRAIAPGKVGT